jgi:hypothetical protein
LDNFRLGCRDLVAVWEKILEPPHMAQFMELAAMARKAFSELFP